MTLDTPVFMFLTRNFMKSNNNVAKNPRLAYMDPLVSAAVMGRVL